MTCFVFQHLYRKSCSREDTKRKLASYDCILGYFGCFLQEPVVVAKKEAGLCEALADWLEIICFSLQQLVA